MKKLFAFAIVFALGTSALFAQEITDEQLDKFANAYLTVQQENNKAQSEMMAVIEGEGLTTQRFNEIYQAGEETDATDKEKKQYDKAMVKIEEGNKALQAQMEDKIKAAGLSVETFQEISKMMQTNPEMQQKVMAKLQSKMQ